jgi:hypothetical protein
MKTSGRNFDEVVGRFTTEAEVDRARALLVERAR